MILTSSSVAELTWWIENMSHSSRDITHPTPFTIIQTDASTLGWGAVYADQEVGGRWTSLESSSHINILELQAAFFALKSFCKGTIKGHVQLQIELQIGPSKRNFDHPSVASSNLVLTGTTAAMQSALDYETFEEPTATCLPTSTPAAQQATPNGLSALRESFTQYNVSPDITKILMTSWRVGTQKWLAFRHQRGITYSSPKINDCLDFLMTLNNQGLSYSTINTARSAYFVHYYR